MTNLYRIVVSVSAALLVFPIATQAGFKGGKPGGGARPAARPASHAPSRPSGASLGGSRPSMSAANRPSINRPSVSRPSGNLPSMNRPAPNLPQGNRPSVTRPSINRPTGNLPQVNRPTVNRPQVTRPTNPSPSLNRPSTLPSVNRPTGGLKPSNRPTTLPGTQRPEINRPGNRPTTLPGIANPTKPGTRPSLPGLGGVGNRPGTNLPNRPGIDVGNRPGSNLPNRPGIGSGRPSPGDVGDFLGLNRPVTLPGEIGGNRPGAGNRPGINLPNQPGGNRPGISRPGRPGGNDFNFGDINIGNTVINNRPSWVNIDNDRISNINNRWGNQIGGIQNWDRIHPDRISQWNRWGNDVRYNWGHYHHHANWFGPNWWHGHVHGCGGWHYGYHFNNHPWNYWWTAATFTSCVNWFSWSAPSAVWSQPVYYDYGTGGNVVYQDNSVYINGQQVASADEFAQSAAALATVPPPADEQVAAEAEWMPLGTFAVTADQKDVDPNRVMQLAVSRDGIISGTLYNTVTDQADAIQGQVDKQTQRVAFRIGESEDIVVETGLYNLTQPEAPVLVHFGAGKVENWLLVRLEQPDEEELSGE